jgi:ADP-L-glycero-D-manno-heptose 6-epimerase
MYIVTGGAGFVGSNIICALNDRGTSDVIVVDRLNSENSKNLAGLRFAEYLDRDGLRAAIARDGLSVRIEAIIHQGACADTTESDAHFMMDNNFTFSKELLAFAISRKIPFVYASSAAVYGASARFEEKAENEHPLNLYGLSKLAFDNHVRGLIDQVETTLVGLRYFNVFGPREGHKGKMASMPYRIFRQIQERGRARLFAGTDGFADGEQRRDFIFVKDVVETNLEFAARRSAKGIFNLGRGASRSFNDVARAIIKLAGKGAIEYVPFPLSLAGKYQSFTEADLGALRKIGYRLEFTQLEEGIAKSFPEWQRESLATDS